MKEIIICLLFVLAVLAWLKIDIDGQDFGNSHGDGLAQAMKDGFIAGLEDKNQKKEA